MERVDWKRMASITVCLLGGGVLLWLFCRFFLGALMPFVLAFLLAALTRPLVRLLSCKTGWPQGVCAVLGTLLSLLLLGFLLYLLCARLFSELQRLFNFLIEDSAKEDGSVARMLQFLREIGTRVPFFARLKEFPLLEEMLGDPTQYLSQQLQKALGELASKLASGIGALLASLPGVLFFFVVTLIACFYFALEYDKVCCLPERVLPPSVRARLPEWKRRFTGAVKRCAKAYLLLFALTFGELFLGFLFLQAEYPFLLALLAASLDILPVLGVGTVLVPWAIFALLTGDVARGVWILVLYAVITVIRQIVEPRLLGKSIGLHPILMLMAFYVGLSLFGVAGILIGPTLALLCKLLFDRAGRESDV